MSISITERNAEIVALVNAGAPRTRIAATYDLSRQRVDQIFAEATEPPKPDTRKSLLAEFGVTTTTVEEKPKARKPKARKPKSPLAAVYAGGKATRKEYRDRMKERLGLSANAKHPETGKGWTCKQLCEAAKARNIFIDC